MSAEQCGPATFSTSELEAIPPEIVEGVLAEGIAEIKGALDDIHDNLGAPRLVECVMANRHAILVELGKVCGMLAPYSLKVLRPKHRAARALFVEFMRRLVDAEISEEPGHGEMARFASDTVGFLECVHMCLGETTTRQRRHYYKKKYLDR